MVRSRLPIIGCVTYMVFLLYASLMPFEFTATPEEVSAHLRHAMGYWPFGSGQHTSKSDVLSNLFVYVPAGLLLATSVAVRRRGGRWWGLVAAVAVSLAASAAVETLQAFSVTRISSTQDVMMNTLGGFGGGLLGIAWGRRAWIGLRRRCRLNWRHDPSRLLGLGMMVLLAADAAYPFMPTIEVSQVAHNVRRSTADLQAGLSLHPWHYWLVTRITVYAMLTILMAAPSRASATTRRLRIVMGMVLFAAIIEAAKVLIVARVANIANIAMSACGVAIGAFIIAVFARGMSARVRLVLAAVLMSGYLSYLELEPLTFVWDVPTMMTKVPSGAEWLPLYSYAMHAGASDVWMFARSIILMAGAAAALVHLCPSLGRSSRVRAATVGAVLTGMLGLLLELAQFTLPGRIPSITDVFCFALGGAIGGWLSCVQNRRLATRVWPER